MDLETWSWIFLVLYVGGMLTFGVIGQRRVRGADDFATARGSYGPLTLSLAFAATTASGATFLGLPGIAYAAGLPAIWSMFLYPTGVYLGVLVCMRLVSRAGHRFGTRSIPEYLGERYQSDPRSDTLLSRHFPFSGGVDGTRISIPRSRGEVYFSGRAGRAAPALLGSAGGRARSCSANSCGSFVGYWQTRSLHT